MFQKLNATMEKEENENVYGLFVATCGGVLGSLGEPILGILFLVIGVAWVALFGNWIR